jgi:hypothetical protein
VEIVAGSNPSLVSGNYHEKYGPVVMEIPSAKAKIRHVFGCTLFRVQVFLGKYNITHHMIFQCFHIQI